MLQYVTVKVSTAFYSTAVFAHNKLQLSFRTGVYVRHKINKNKKIYKTNFSDNKRELNMANKENFKKDINPFKVE